MAPGSQRSCVGGGGLNPNLATSTHLLDIPQDGTTTAPLGQPVLMPIKS